MVVEVTVVVAAVVGLLVVAVVMEGNLTLIITKFTVPIAEDSHTRETCGI